MDYFADHDKKIWTFDLSAYEELQKKVSELNPDVVIGQLPNFVLKLLRQGKFFFQTKEVKSLMKILCIYSKKILFHIYNFQRKKRRGFYVPRCN